MKVCFPVQQDQGIDSVVFNHFGSAPAFIVVDTGSKGITTIQNGDKNHAHGACNPLKALDNQKIDVVIVGGIGAGALSRLGQAGIRVYRSAPGTINENLSLLERKELAEYAMQGCCGGHGHDHGSGGGCAHH
ncbi:MAG: NifB/NifX family molybdenum-iron cluster-binding protein [Nitrospirota bacterium]|nr:NifB/NifX family molybdenum-iron cluster-binding protein [Nitrospirota bacterium]